MLALLLVFQTLAGCADVADCRAQAQAAAARGDYEVFHDLAWRAVQKGPRNDPDLMYLLARAQALSGRYGDALVMLGRLADLAAPTDALTNPDFAVMRQLRDWPALEAKLSGRPVPAAGSPSPASPGGSTPPSLPSTATTGTAAADAGDVLAFEGKSLDPFALAHDAVSRRFLLGDRRESRLVIVDEQSHHLVNYVSAASSSFLQNLTGLTIDSRRGDLWVTSAKGEGEGSASMLHKLQLVSGRTLAEITPPADAGGVRFAGVTVTPDGTVYALDAVDSRLYRVRPGARAMELAMRLDARHAATVVAADDRVLYVATAGGLSHVDVGSRAAAPVKGADLAGFESLAWRGGALIGVQHAGDSYLVVRLTLDASGTRVQRRTVLATSASPTVGTVARDAYYYLSDAGTIRRLSLR